MSSKFRRFNPAHSPESDDSVSYKYKPFDELSSTIRMSRGRMLFGVALFALAFSSVTVRLYEVALFPEKVAKEARTGKVQPKVSRAEILDRNGVVLATNLTTASIYANPKIISDKQTVARDLAFAITGRTEAEILELLQKDTSFVWIKRNASPKEQYSVNSLGVPGINFIEEEKRIYPYGSLVSHTVGYVNIDNSGISGVERSYEKRLSEPSANGKPEPVKLSLDVRVQGIVKEELQKSIDKFAAKGGAGIVADPKTGEIIAMVSLPDFDPHKPGRYPDEAKFNKSALGVYEMGSTFKTLTFAMAIDKANISLEEGFDATNPIRYARYTINDSHGKKRWLSVPEIFMYSSNIGTAKMVMKAGIENQRKFLENLGMMKPIETGLPEKAIPLAPPNWGELTAMTVSFGHGLAVTPLHLVQGINAVVNDGVMKSLTIEAGKETEQKRVISSATSYKMRQLLRLVVDKGTGSKSNVEGYFVGGKTGTAEKLVNGRYDKDLYMSSFVASFPINNPQYTVYVMIDEPKGTKDTYGYATGGWTAAPTVGRIIERMGPVVGVHPVNAELYRPQEQPRFNANHTNNTVNNNTNQIQLVNF